MAVMTNLATIPLMVAGLLVAGVAGCAGTPTVATSGPAADVRVTVARTDITNLGMALDAFEVDCGRYPPTKEGLGALIDPPANAKAWRGPYLKKGLPKDPWGNPYVYRCPGRHTPGGYDLHSFGPDGKDGGGDDVDNWSRK